MFENDVLERRQLALQEAESPESVSAVGRPNAQPSNAEVQARAPLPPESPGEWTEWPAQPEEEQPQATRKKRRKGFLKRRPVAFAIGTMLLASVLGGGYLYLDYAEHFESTDDAFIAARQSALAPKVSGYITAVPVTDNEHIAAGDVIARIDDRDYRIALDQAEAQVAAAQASIENIDAQLQVQQAQISANEAQVEQAQAALVFAEQQNWRYQELAQKGSGTIQNAQQYSSQLRQQQAALASAQATLKLAQRQIEALKAQRSSAVASLAQAKAQRDQAQLNLSYTTVTAAQPGRVVIDAYPEREIRGHVDSVQPGSGTAFSLLPAQNATGNYVKIVQRVPVKIVMDDPPTDVALGPGMSVVPTVRIDPMPSLVERLMGWM
jgi:membrane fusion protein (multidrug efflux system)